MNITDHKFAPKGEWWALCKHCNFAESAHAETEIRYYSDDTEIEDEPREEPEQEELIS